MIHGIISSYYKGQKKGKTLTRSHAEGNTAVEAGKDTEPFATEAIGNAGGVADAAGVAVAGGGGTNAGRLFVKKTQLAINSTCLVGKDV